MKKSEIIYIAILVLCIIILIVGALFDNHCETFLGILAIISGLVAYVLCVYGVARCLTNIEI